MKKTIFIFVIVIGGLIGFLTYNSINAKKDLLNKHDQIFYESFKRYPNVIASSSRGVATDSELLKLMKHYESEKYDKALHEFNEYLATHPEEYEVLFYRGITYLKLEKPGKAIDDLTRVIDANLTLVDQAKWYLALAYVKINNIDAAVPLLDDLASGESARSEQSKAVLDQLN